MPSRWHDPGPLSALEAFSAGTPVVTYPSGGLAEYVAAAKAGAVVDPDPQALARTTVALARFQAAWEGCSAGGLRAALETHAPHRYAERLERLYRQTAREEAA
jgi:glycosyltransferase involved in cell wall biosynthesis